MLRAAFLIGTTGFWLMSMSMLIQKEYFELTAIRTPYEVLPLHDALVREDYFGTYMGNHRIGFTRIALEAMPENKDAQGNIPYLFRHVTFLSFLLLGRENEMMVKGEASLDSQLYLKGFDLVVSSKDYKTEILGEIADGTMNIKIQDKSDAPVERSVPLTDPVLYVETLNYIWTPANLKIGKEGRLKVWNPLTLNSEDLEFRIDRKEVIKHLDKETEAFVINLAKDDLETKTWITAEGTVLQILTPTGLMLKNEPAWQVFDALRAERNSRPDLPNLYSITPDREIENHENLDYLKIKLKSPSEEKIIEIEKSHFDRLRDIPLKGYEDPSLAALTETSDFIQSNDPKILETAKSIIGHETSALEASLKLMRWVHENVIPAPTASIPSAKQVLEVKKGDCNEYTALFTALARAAGIPTKMIAGIVYQQGRFFYHAWAEVYIDEWIGLDPTFGQAPIDITHIPLVEGELQKQIELASQIGSLSIYILSTEKKAAEDSYGSHDSN